MREHGALGQAALAQAAERKHGAWSAIRRFVRTKPLGTFGVLVISGIFLMAIFANVIAPYDPFETSSERKFVPPGQFPYLLGTDDQGKDLFSRVVFGARVSLYVGFLAVTMGTVVGSLLGTISGYFGGWFDLLFQRVMDAVMSIPLIVLSVVIVSVLEPSLNNILIALAIGIIPSSGRVVRGAALGVKQNQYVEAARAVGCSNSRILVLYILPNVFAPIIVLGSVTLGAAIIAESSLGFLGLGPPPPLVSWGSQLSGTARLYMERAPWIAIVPGFAIMITVLSFNLLGDALRDVLDPRLRS